MCGKSLVGWGSCDVKPFFQPSHGSYSFSLLFRKRNVVLWVFLRYMIFAPLNATFTLQCFVTGMKILKYCICKKLLNVFMSWLVH